MAISKTNFINFTRCPRYVALEEIQKEKLDADISYYDYKEQELQDNLNEMISSMIEINEETGEEIDLVNQVNRQLEAMMDYYKLVEMEAGRISEKTFGGTSLYALNTKEQECFDFSLHGIKYLCYVDIYNEKENDVRIIEVKATTSKKYIGLSAGHKKQDKFSIWYQKNNIHYLKGEIDDYPLEEEMPIDAYQKQVEKLFDRYHLGQYVYDLAVQRYFIEHEFESTNTVWKLKNFHYYLAVLNADYIFDGTYEDGKPVYNIDENENELITFFDMTKITEVYQQYVEQDRIKLESYLNHLEASPCPLGISCGFKKQSGCFLLFHLPFLKIHLYLLLELVLPEQKFRLLFLLAMNLAFLIPLLIIHMHL